MKQLLGRSAVITGASSGIGRQLAFALAGRGMNLVLAARSGDKLDSLAAELTSQNGRAVAQPADVTRRDDLVRLVDRAVGEFGTVDVLVNNAGIETYSDFHHLPVEDVVRTVDVNLTAALVLTRLVLPHMLGAGRGHVVNMSSTAGKHGPAYGAAYGATKAGLISLTESLRAEYKGRGVSASAICPGFTNDSGIYERMKQAVGKGTPPLMGATSMSAVTRAVIRAIQRDRPEALINWPPMRPITVLAEALPSLGEWLVRFGSARFLRKVARSRNRERDRIAA